MVDASKYDSFYKEYHGIDPRSFYDRIEYYEDNTLAVSLLDFHRRLEINIDYTICLFETGNYQAYLQNVDPLIVDVVNENISEMKGRDIFLDLVFKKGACLYNQKKYDASLNIARQLLGIQSEMRFIILHQKAKRGVLLDRLVWVKYVFLFSMLLFLVSAIVHLFIILPYFDKLDEGVALFRNITFSISISFLLFQELYLKSNVIKELRALHRRRNFKITNTL